MNRNKINLLTGLIFAGFLLALAGAASLVAPGGAERDRSWRFDKDTLQVAAQPAAGTLSPKSPPQPPRKPDRKVPPAPAPRPTHTSSQTPASCPVGVAHRGAPTEAPENTLPAVQLAYGAGAAVVEVDVQWTSDDVPVAMHDGSIDRTTNGTGTVPAQTYAALSALKANDFAPWSTDSRYANVRIPRIADLLDAVPAGREILLDIHNSSPTQAETAALHALLSARGMLARGIVMADPVILAAMDGWFPDLRTRAIENPATNVIRPGWWVKSYGDGYVVPQGRIDSFPVVNYWHQYELIVWVWAPNAWPDWDRLRNAGVDGMITDEIRDYLAWCAS